MNTSTPIEAGSPDRRNDYETPRLTPIGNATELVLGFSDLDGNDYFGYARSEFEFEPDGEDAGAR